MKSKIYTEEEIVILKKNPFVKEIEYNRFIKYDPVFKLWCVLARKYYPEITARRLFVIGGFPIEMMNPELPQKRIKSWVSCFKRFGEDYFLTNKEYEMLEMDLSSIECEKDETYLKLKKQIYSEVKELLSYGS